MSVHYPWPAFRSQWGCDVEGFQVDGKPHDEVVHHEHLRIRADQLDAWTTMTCSVRARTTEATPDDLSGLRPFVVISSPRTQLRQSVPLALVQTEDGSTEYVGEFSLPRSVLAAAVTVRVDVGALHNDRLRIVGSSSPWTLIIDPSEAPRSPGAPPFKTAWVDFSSDAASPECRQHPKAYALMDLTGSEPTLLLNTKIDGFRHLLLADKAKTERRRHRDLLGVDLARYAVATLFRSASDEISGIDDDDPVEPPSTPLSRQVCEAVAGAMTGIGSVDDLYEGLARSDQLSVAARASLWAEIDLAIDALTGVSDTVAGICTEVKHA